MWLCGSWKVVVLKPCLLSTPTDKSHKLRDLVVLEVIQDNGIDWLGVELKLKGDENINIQNFSAIINGKERKIIIWHYHKA